MSEQKLPVINCTVKIIDTDTQVLSEVLGISEERNNELFKITMRTWEDHENISIVIVKVSEQCKHPNELAWCMMQLGANISRSQEPSFIKMLRKLSND